MKNKSVHSCRFVNHDNVHWNMTTLNKLFKIEFERGDWKRAKKMQRTVPFNECVEKAYDTVFSYVKCIFIYLFIVYIKIILKVCCFSKSVLQISMYIII